MPVRMRHICVCKSFLSEINIAVHTMIKQKELYFITKQLDEKCFLNIPLFHDGFFYYKKLLKYWNNLYI